MGTGLTADSCLFLGTTQVLSNKEAATNFLNNAGERYEKTLAASAGPLARERAMFGKARILETMGKLPEATAAYQEVIKEFPQGTFKTIVDQRLEQLGKPDTAEFYKALAEYKPKPKKEAAEKSAAGPSGKAESLTLPENPDMPPLAAPAGAGREQFRHGGEHSQVVRHWDSTEDGDAEGRTAQGDGRIAHTSRARPIRRAAGEKVTLTPLSLRERGRG